jgi:molecular chaperone HtpG
MNQNIVNRAADTLPANQPFHFQVNLGAMIDLLSNHLYSGPQVYIRELLQNAVDAIRARQMVEPEHRGEVTLEIVAGCEGTPAVLVVEDNGIGLTLEQIHTLLATIGSSSKRDDLEHRRADYIGQFGIGLLSCFMVTEEIVLITRANGPGQAAIEWRGKADGSYTIRVLEHEIAPGTKVFLRARPERADLFRPSYLRDMARHYGSLLSLPITLSYGGQKTRINASTPPWKESHPTQERQREAYRQYARDHLELDPFDFIPLSGEIEGLEGALYILPSAANLTGHRAHQVYLKGMLLTEKADNVLPEWAFFVKGVLNSTRLRPTASRETIYEDEALAATRRILGRVVRDYLMRLCHQNPERLRRLISLHARAFRILAAEDDEFARVIIGYLPFETTLGTLTLPEVSRHQPELLYVKSLEEFRQISQVAAAQSVCIINAGYTYAEALVARYADLFPNHVLRKVNVGELVASLAEITPVERERGECFVAAAQAILQPLRCRVSTRKFQPVELPVLYAASEESMLFRSVERNRAITSGFWQEVVDSVIAQRSAADRAELCFNYANPLVQRLLGVRSPQLTRAIVEMLYVDALRTGGHPLKAAELQMANRALVNLLDWVTQSPKEVSSC